MPKCKQNATIYSILATDWALFRYCWRYFDVWTIFPPDITGRMLCTSVLESKHAQLYAKCDHLLDFDNTLRVISLLLEVFRSLIAFSIAFYTPIATHAAFSVETCPTVRKMGPLTRFWRHTESYFAFVGDISMFKRYFHRTLHAECYARQFHRR